MVSKNSVPFSLDEFEPSVLEGPAVAAHGVAGILFPDDRLFLSAIVDLEPSRMCLREAHREAVAVDMIRHFSMAIPS